MDYFLNPSFPRSLSKLTCLLCLSVALLVGTCISAQQLCDSSFSRYDLNQSDPDLSHEIYQTDRWRCVTRTFVSGSQMGTSYSSLSEFDTALSNCMTEATEVSFTTNSDVYELLYNGAAASRDIIAASGVLDTAYEQENACFLIENGPGPDKDIRDVEEYSTGLIPTTYFYYSGTLDGQLLQAAHLLPWSNYDSDNEQLPSIALEYVPESEQSHCFDPLCQAGSTSAVQFEYTPIEPGLGTVDYTIPIFPSGFPGLVPLSLHYSSHSAIRQAEEAYNKASIYDIRGWHHSYDKKLREGDFGSGLLTPDTAPKQVFILTPSEDLLIFESDSSDVYHNVSHPGVKTIVTKVGDGYEASRPDGYLERYNSIGRLEFVRYPDGEEITITSGFDMASPYGFFYDDITRNHPPATTRVYRTYTREPLSVRSVENPDYGVNFGYAPHPFFEGLFPQLTQITRPDGSAFSINQSLNLEKLMENRPLLNSVSFNGTPVFSVAYDEDGKALAVSDVEGPAYQLNYTSDSSESITSRYGAIYLQNSNTYSTEDTDHWGELRHRSVTQVSCEACGFSESTSYQADGMISSQTRTGERPYSASFNAAGLVDSVSLDNSKQRSFTWDTEQQQLTEISGSDLITARFTYTDDRVSSTTLDGGDASRTIETPRVNGQISQVSGIGNNVVSIDHNAQGFVTQVTDSADRTFTFSDHNSLGQPQQLVDPNDIETLIEYDIMGRVLSITRDDEVRLTAVYTPAGQPQTVTLGEQVYNYTYDSAFRLNGVTDGNGEQIDINYLANGLVGRVNRTHKGAGRLTSFDYDVEGNTSLTRQVFESGSFQRSYNSRGQVTQESDGPNSTTYEYDANAYLSSVTENGEQTQFGRDAKGRLTSLTTSGGQQTTFSYTGLGEQTQQLNSNWGHRNYSYNPAGNMTQASTPLLTQSYNHTLVDDVQSKTSLRNDASSPAITTHYGYDDDSESVHGKNYGVGRLTSIENGFAGYAYRYNRRGDLAGISLNIDPAGHPDPITMSVTDEQISYTYAIDEVASITYPSGDTISYERDPESRRITRVSRNDNSVVELAYANALQPSTELSFDNELTSIRAFDDRDRVTNIAVSQSLWSEDYDYDEAANLTSITTNTSLDLNGDQTFVYDTTNQLTEASGDYGVFQYSYDAHKNRTSTNKAGAVLNYSYQSGTSRLLSVTQAPVIVAARNLSYDDDGNIITDGNYNLEYDAEGRLRQVLEGDTVVATYTYDPYGRRVSKRTSSETLFFKYDERDRLLEEADESGALVRQYLYGEGKELLAVYVADSDQVLAVHSDFLGAPIFLTDSSKNVVWAAKRQPFGSTEITMNTVDFPLRSSNQYYDGETGYHYNEQRYYEPEIGRYLRNDPIGLEGGQNPYNFALQNPLKYVDLDGRQAIRMYSYHPKWEDPELRAAERKGDLGAIIGGMIVLAPVLAPEALLIASARLPKVTAFATELTAAEVGVSTGGIAIATKGTLVNTTKAVLRQKAGFSDKGKAIILDSNLEAKGLADALRAKGFNVRSVSEIFGKDVGDPAINRLANQLGARVLTRDRGRQIGEGFGSNAINVNSRVRGTDGISRILGDGLK